MRDRLIVVAAISQWRRHLCACVRAHRGHFEHILWCFHDSVVVSGMQLLRSRSAIRGLS